MLPACGYIAARVSRQNGLLVGAITGMLIAMISAFAYACLTGEQWHGKSLTATTLGFMLKYGFYAALGGGIGELHSRKGL